MTTNSLPSTDPGALKIVNKINKYTNILTKFKSDQKISKRIVTLVTLANLKCHLRASPTQISYLQLVTKYLHCSN